MEQLAQFVAYLLITLSGGATGYWQLRRKNKLDVFKLRQQVVILEAVSKHQGQQLIELAHFKVLYETLKEAHDGLKSDHEALKIEVNALREKDADKQALIDRQQAELLMLRNHEAALTAEVAKKRVVEEAYERAFVLLGQQIKQVEETNDEPK